MRGLNKVMLIGHLGKDPEMQHLESGVTLCRFSLATNEAYKDKSGNRVDKTEWHNIVVWRALADTAGKYLKKGSLIYLEGKISTRSWTDKDNVKRYTTEIVADTFTMLDRKEGSASMAPPSDMGSVPMPESDAPGADDLPF